MNKRKTLKKALKKKAREGGYNTHARSYGSPIVIGDESQARAIREAVSRIGRGEVEMVANPHGEDMSDPQVRAKIRQRSREEAAKNPGMLKALDSIIDKAKGGPGKPEEEAANGKDGTAGLTVQADLSGVVCPECDKQFRLGDAVWWNEKQLVHLKCPIDS